MNNYSIGVMEDSREQITTIENSSPARVIRKTTTDEHSMPDESPEKVFEKKKTVFRFNQAIWYILGVIEILLGFRFVLKALGANPFNGFTNFIYSLSDPAVFPFSGIFRISGNSIYVLEWSTLIAMAVYALIAYGIVEILQFIKPVTQNDIKHAAI